VYASGIPLEIVPLEMTARTLLCREEVHDWNELGRAGAMFAAGTLGWIQMVQQRFNSRGCNLHDPLAAACLLAPELFEFMEIEPAVDLHTGKTHIIRSGAIGSQIRLVTNFDGERIGRLLLEGFAAAFGAARVESGRV
jgi:inosine-uridine nucleoside N-ribohydrolase